MSKTRFNEIIADWKRVKNHCRTTDNKDFSEKDATETFKKKLLISEHTPIRLLEFDWSWPQIPYWVSTEMSRHKFEKFISTQRDDRTHIEIPRGDKPQNAPVNFDGYANMQNLIDMCRKRLCAKATPQARGLAEDLKRELHKTNKNEADVLVPNCVYRGFCPEFTSCGFWEKMAYKMTKEELISWESRYAFYNKRFYERMNQDA